MVAAITVSTLTLQPDTAQAVTDPSADLPVPRSDSSAAAPSALPERSRDSFSGKSWKRSTDAVVTSTGDADGFSVLRGTAKSGYAMQTLTTLAVPGVETDQWIGNTCVTENGEYVGVVYGPREFTNDDHAFNEGGWAAIVDTADGSVQSLGRGYSMAYFNPGCSSTSTVAFSRFDGIRTHIGAADAATGRHLLDVAVDGQVTSPIAQEGGRVLAAGPHGILDISEDGARSLVKTQGVAYDLSLAEDGALSWIDRKGDVATVRRLHDAVDPSGPATPEVVASGTVNRVGVRSDAAGRTWVLGASNDRRSATHTSLRFAPDVAPTSELSTEGAVASETPEALETNGGAQVVVPLTSTASGATAEVRATTTPDGVPAVTQSIDGTRIDGPRRSVATPARTARVTPAAATGLAATTVGSASNPAEAERTCAVARNDVRMQAAQPMPRQVEWAVNRAVRGELTEARPANWRNLAMSAYTPQGMFPRTALTGGGQIPDQVLLGVLMQESNLWQASRYTSPGETGNPLIGNFYGTDRDASTSEASFWKVAFDNADCGYGVGQITDGMRVSSSSPANNPAMPAAKQQAVAVDYQANIARAQQMLAAKWNQLQAKGITINNNDPSKIENWFGAVWIYNTGYQGPDDKGYEGLGWSNNPGNPNYPQNRLPFLDGRPSDASKPQNWPYPEKVMGFAAFSQGLIERQTARGGPEEVGGFRTASWNGGDVEGPRNRSKVKPPLDTFCNPKVNACNTGAAPGCTRVDSHCWWEAKAVWKQDCATTCGVAFHRFSPASSYMTEASASVGKSPSFPPACARTAELPSVAKIVDDLSLSVESSTMSQKPVNPACGSPVASQGSFRFDFGRASDGSYPSKIDTHQLGGGFNGHFFFTHTRADAAGYPSRVSGTWNLGESMAGKWGRVYVHTPDHAAWTQQAVYQVDRGDGKPVSRALPQRTYANTWRSIGVFQFSGTPKVTLTNLTADGEDYLDDIAWDAVAFEPLSAKPKDIIVSMGDSFSSGEGARGTKNGNPYYAETDNFGTEERSRNACHRSDASWSRKAAVSTSTMSIGARADANDPTLDYHFIACSGAVAADVSANAAGERGTKTRELPQIEQGYLDENTTLVTITIGGNDIGFSDVVRQCVVAGKLQTPCRELPQLSNGKSLENKTKDLTDASEDKVLEVLSSIQQAAPNAKIAILGYPPMFSNGVSCVSIKAVDQEWLDAAAEHLNATVKAAAARANRAGHAVYFGDPKTTFSGRNICSSSPAINGLVEYDAKNGGTPWNGDKPLVDFPWPGDNVQWGVSQQSFHPNTVGTGLYATVLQDTLRGRY
ncbi:SGNH/GDSL hydrolase family protein [Curtobacterium sp. Leaf154]|uniref:SGNH/GDSL hydrolase family protein n=1 Tax=Curtobacterium sp. Leaf154 TaxID=1736277 RepID=UPI0012E83C85|nr:GDSL-type esterase/lipase family protein [Curtobacterium sp. Leaf154]